MSDEHSSRSIRTIPELRRESSRENLASVSLLEALDKDERPSFAVSVQQPPPNDPNIALQLLYSNTAAENLDGLLASVSCDNDDGGLFTQHVQPRFAFRKWLRGVVDENDIARRGNSYMFSGHIWVMIPLGDHKVVSGTPTSYFWPEVTPSKHREDVLGEPKNLPIQGKAPTIPPTPSFSSLKITDKVIAPRGTRHGPYDVTLRDPPESILSDHIKHFRSIDWASTPLGAMADWSSELRTVVNMCLNDVHPCMLFWGDDVIMIYNAAYVQVIGVMHPLAMGRSARTVASDYWPTFQPLVDHINATGRSVYENELPIFIDRLGFLEETYWSFQFIPVLDNKGHVSGYYHPLFETTRYRSPRSHSDIDRVSKLTLVGISCSNAVFLASSSWDLRLVKQGTSTHTGNLRYIL